MADDPPPDISEEPAPPPAYETTIQTVNGSSVRVWQTYQVINANPGRPEMRVIHLKTETGNDSDYAIGFPGGVLTTKFVHMKVTRPQKQSAVAADIVVSASRSEANIAKISTGQHRDIAVTEAKHSGSGRKDKELHFPVTGTGLPAALRWHPSAAYLHLGKGKGRVGDYELSDSENVYAVFFNRWTGDQHQKDLGTLCFMPAAVEQGLADVVVATFVVVGDHLTRRKRDEVGKVLAGVAAAGVMICVVQ